MVRKTIDNLTPDDLRAFPVWKFMNADEDIDETVVTPVRTVPVKSLAGRLVATEVRLADGSYRWALIGNIVPENVRLTSHFLSLTLYDRGECFQLARYHDRDVTKRGPHALAKFLRLPVDAVFPIAYDIRKYATGKAGALKNTIQKEPAQRLTRSEIIALAVP